MKHRHYCKHFVSGVILFIFFIVTVSVVSAETAKEFRQKVEDRYEGDDSSAIAVMKLQKIKRDQNGNIQVQAERIRSLNKFTKAYGKDDKAVMFFLKPADVRDTAFLSYVYDAKEKDNDMWLYLPALKKIKRIASGDKSGSFMGTDFSYVDINDIKVNDYTHRFLADDELKGLLKDKSVAMIFKKKFGKTKAGFTKTKKWILSGDYRVVESIPEDKKVRNDDGYARIIDWIDPATLLIEKSIYFGKNSRAFKVKEITKKEKIQNIWSFTEVVMENFKKNHRTLINTNNVKYNIGIKDSYFTQRTLEEGL